MARKSTIRVLRTTRSALNAQAAATNLVAGEPYLITDEQRFAVALTTGTYQDFMKAGEVTGGGGGAAKFSAAIGDGSAVNFTLTHNLNSRDVLVEVYSAATPYDKVLVDVAHATVNTVVVGPFDVAPAAGQYRAVVIG